MMDHSQPPNVSGTEGPSGRSGPHRSHGSTSGGLQDAHQQVANLDVSWLVDVDLAIVDALARLQLAARRSGRSLRLHGPCPMLAWWLERTGLSEVISVCTRGPDCRCATGGDPL
jgi:hypothetical protein